MGWGVGRGALMQGLKSIMCSTCPGPVPLVVNCVRCWWKYPIARRERHKTLKMNFYRTRWGYTELGWLSVRVFADWGCRSVQLFPVLYISGVLLRNRSVLLGQGSVRLQDGFVAFLIEFTDGTLCAVPLWLRVESTSRSWKDSSDGCNPVGAKMACKSCVGYGVRPAPRVPSTLKVKQITWHRSHFLRLLISFRAHTGSKAREQALSRLILTDNCIYYFLFTRQ